ncbi:hypothetical protein [Sphingobacterium hotanense]|uniref:hypothetical protein n=1 Tax=Sphingobacterium hotanense TaxID=649196 RepID=UPI0011F351A2|nr:hypothetical protein [Sphingobacterium hotanense]
MLKRILTRNTHDHVRRLLDTHKKINARDSILQSRMCNNEIGQLMSKGLHYKNTLSKSTLKALNLIKEQGKIEKESLKKG